MTERTQTHTQTNRHTRRFQENLSASSGKAKDSVPESSATSGGSW